jgi:hypothetical protein
MGAECDRGAISLVPMERPASHRIYSSATNRITRVPRALFMWQCHKKGALLLFKILPTICREYIALIFSLLASTGTHMPCTSGLYTILIYIYVCVCVCVCVCGDYIWCDWLHKLIGKNVIAAQKSSVHAWNKFLNYSLQWFTFNSCVAAILKNKYIYIIAHILCNHPVPWIVLSFIRFQFLSQCLVFCMLSYFNSQFFFVKNVTDAGGKQTGKTHGHLKYITRP